MSELLKILGQAQSTASPRGLSYWSACARSGRSVRLSEQYGEGREAESADRAEKYGNQGKCDPLVLGSMYHLLQQKDFTGQLEGEVWDATLEGLTLEMLEALRLFRAYKEKWGSAVQKWGFDAGTYSSELMLPVTDAGKALVREVMGEDVTGQLDGVGYISDIAAVEARTGLILPGPGYFILDFKTAGQKNAGDEFKFAFGEQAMNYISLWNLENPDRQVRGMLFDQITRTKSPGFHHFFSSALHADMDVVRNIVKIGKYNYDNNICNPVTCATAFGPCHWRKLGICDGK